MYATLKLILPLLTELNARNHKIYGTSFEEVLSSLRYLIQKLNDDFNDMAKTLIQSDISKEDLSKLSEWRTQLGVLNHWSNHEIKAATQSKRAVDLQALQDLKQTCISDWCDSATVLQCTQYAPMLLLLKTCTRNALHSSRQDNIDGYYLCESEVRKVVARILEQAPEASRPALRIFDLSAAFPASHIAYRNRQSSVALEVWRRTEHYDLNTDMLGQTLVHLAAAAGDLNFLRDMASAYEDEQDRDVINNDRADRWISILAQSCPDSLGHSPLHFAAYRNDEYSFRFLCDEGCLSSTSEFQVVTVLDLAVVKESYAVIPIITERYLVPGPYTMTLQRAITGGNRKILHAVRPLFARLEHTSDKELEQLKALAYSHGQADTARSLQELARKKPNHIDTRRDLQRRQDSVRSDSSLSDQIIPDLMTSKQPTIHNHAEYTPSTQVDINEHDDPLADSLSFEAMLKDGDVSGTDPMAMSWLAGNMPVQLQTDNPPSTLRSSGVGSSFFSNNTNALDEDTNTEYSQLSENLNYINPKQIYNMPDTQ